MIENIIKINTISELHSILGLKEPKHPHISVIEASELAVPRESIGTKIIQDFYMIALKDKSCGMEYGRNSYDFDEGVMAFSSPGQVYVNTKELNKGEINGYLVYFHQDLIRNTPLIKVIEDCTFFNYEVSEALHLSKDEETNIVRCIEEIISENEFYTGTDIQKAILPILGKLLQHCALFYERQFSSRANKNKDILSQFEKELKNYFSNKKALDNGIPRIDYFSEKVHLSQNYFSDLIRKETGRTPKDHINDHIVAQAKIVLQNSSTKVSEIAYLLGFNYPHYFTRLFKLKTGYTPVEFRKMN